VKRRGPDLGGVVDDAGGQPRVGGPRGGRARFTGGGYVGGVRRRGQVVDRADFGHPFTVTLSRLWDSLVASLVEDAAAAARPARPAALPALFQRPVLDRGGALPVQVTQQPLEPLPARHEPGGLRVRVVQHDSLRFGLPTVVAQEDRLGG